MTSSPDRWWPRLPQQTREWLVEHNGEVLSDEAVLDLSRVAGPVSADPWWVGHRGPDGVYLSDECVDWVEAVANGETPEGVG
ncbi:MAG: hypothetical protein Q7T56_08810 [Nocardioidaceae bacterium]|nr:hypothetical protein [Nocardioidaceae bacterium]